MKKALIILFVFGLYELSLGQYVSIPENYEARENVRELGSTDGTGAVQTFDNRYQGVKGTPFVYQDWHPGDVFTSDKKKFRIDNLNYDCFQNSIVYLDDQSKQILSLNKYTVEMFRLFGKDTLVFVPLLLPGEKDQIFAQILYNRRSYIYKIFKKEFLPANFEGGYSADRRQDEFVDKYDLLFRKHDDNTLYRVKNSTKYMIAAFEDKSSEVSSFIKKNSLKFKDEGDVLRLMEYYDSL